MNKSINMLKLKNNIIIKNKIFLHKKKKLMNYSKKIKNSKKKNKSAKSKIPTYMKKSILLTNKSKSKIPINIPTQSKLLHSIFKNSHLFLLILQSISLKVSETILNLKINLINYNKIILINNLITPILLTLIIILKTLIAIKNK
jgi:hypothetical protein